MDGDASNLVLDGTSAWTRFTAKLCASNLGLVPPLAPAVNTDDLTGDLTELLKHAENLFGLSQCTAAEGDNAVTVLRRMLALQPHHAKATEMLTKIAISYEKVALIWQDRGRPDQALAQVRNGLKAQPTNARLLRLE